MKLVPLSRPLSAVLFAVSLCACGGADRAAGPAIVTQPTVPGTPAPPPATPAPSPVNQPPVVDLKTASTVEAGQPLAFDGSGSRDPEGGALALHWDFADGQRGGGARIAHVFSGAGEFSVRLTATDVQGASASATRRITVTAAPAAVRTQAVAGTVRSRAGALLSGVTVSVTGGATATSDAEGRVSLPLGVGVPQTLRFAKAGFAAQVLSLTVPASSGSDAGFDVQLLPQAAAVTLADAARGGTVSGTDGASLTLPANALVTASGAPVTGAVQVNMTPVDVTQPRAGGFPGRFAGINGDASVTPLVSLGPTEFVLAQGGSPVQLAPGAAATLLMPIYADRDLDGRVFAAGDRIPLWSLDEASGMWIGEGEGVLVASASSPTGLAMQASVQHFTWWNPDKPFIPRLPPVKMKCVYDDDIGLPESRNQFAQATLCNWIAEMDRGIPEQKSAVKAQPAPEARWRIVGFSGMALIPTDGSTARLDVPVDNDVNFTVTALNGRFVGSGKLRAGDGVTELVVKMRPAEVTTPGGESITLPYDQVLTLSEARTLGFSGSAFRWARITVSHQPQGSEQAPAGSLRLLRGTVPLAVRNTLVDRRTLTRLLPEDGRYALELAPTSNTPARLRVQVSLAGSDTDETLPLPFGSISRFPDALKTLRLTLPIEAARTLYLTSRNSESQMRLTAPDGSVPFNTEAGSAQRSVGDERSLRLAQTGNAVLQIAALDESAATLQLGATLSHWLPVTPLLDGFALADFASDRRGVPTVLLVRTTGSGEDARSAFSLRQVVDGAWQELGPELGNLRVMVDQFGVAQAAFAFDADNAPILLYGADTTIAGNGSSEFRALRLSAQGWQPVANATGLVSSARVSPFAAPRLLMDTQNRPVAGLAIGNSGGVQLAMLDNGQWRAPSDTTRGADRFDGEYFDITAENNGRIYLATAPRSGNGTVVRRFTPTPAPGVWETVGPNGGLLPQPADERSAFAPRIAIDANGNAMVAGSSQRFTAVWRFNGTSWTNGAASRPSANNFAGFLTGFALLGPRALMAHVDTLATSNGSVPRPVVQANDAADVTTGLGPHAGAVPQFTATFAFNRSGQNGRLLNLGGTVYQAIQNGSTQVQVLRLTE